MRVFVARHGETTWNVAGRYQGRRESTLTPRGERQAHALLEPMRAAGVGRIISSPLMRCVETARPTADAMRLPIERDERLIEIAHGTWEDRLREEIAANDPVRYHAWRHDPANVAFENGESLADVVARWNDFAAALRAHEPTLVVTHDAVLRVAIVVAARRGLDRFWDAKVENGAYAVFDVDDGAWTLVDERVNAHLADDRAAVEGQAL